MIYSLGPLFQDALDRLLRKGETRQDLIKKMTSTFNDDMGRRIMNAVGSGVPGLDNVRLAHSVAKRSFRYVRNIDALTILLEENPALSYNEPEGPIGINLELRQEIPETILESGIGRRFDELGGMHPRLNSLIGHLPIQSFEILSDRVNIFLDDSAYRIRMSTH